jgi:hypothetical protein
MRAPPARVAAPSCEEAAKNFDGGLSVCPRPGDPAPALATTRAMLGHPLHHGDGHGAQQQDVDKAAFSQQHAERPERKQRQSYPPDYQFTFTVAGFNSSINRRETSHVV